MGLPRNVYDEITSTDQAGPNKQGSKAAKLRRYPIPPKYNVPGSSGKGDRTLTIYLAIITDSYVFVLEDFSRLARMWWKSRTRKWLSHEIAVDSKVSRELDELPVSLSVSFSDLGRVYI